MIALSFVFVGMALFLATNTAFATLHLSRHYVAAPTETQRSYILSAGQAMLAITEGARILPLIPLGAFMLSTIMLSSKVFSKTMAWLGILGFLFLSASGLFAGYATTGPMTALMSAIVGITYAGGGLLSFVWYILIGLRLLKLGQIEQEALRQPA
jgi:hypothetical protein